MAQSIDELSVQITAATTKAKNSIDKLVDSLCELRDAVSSLDVQNVNSMGNALQNVGSALSNIKANDVGNTLKRIGSACKSAKKEVDSFRDSTVEGFQYPAVIKEMGTSLVTTSRDVSTSLDVIQNNVNRFDVAPFTTALSRASELMETFIDARERLLTGPQSTPRYLIGKENIIDGEWWEVDEEGIRNERNEYENLEKSILSVADAKSTALANNDEGKTTRSLSVIRQLNTALSTLSGGLKKVRNTISGILPGFNNISQTTKKSEDSFDKLKSTLDRFTKSLTRNMKMLRLMVVRMGLRAIIDDAKNGLVNLIKFSNQFGGSISTLWNSARQLGNAAASAVSPLINALAPALNYVIQLAIKAVNIINQLISTLTGSGTWDRAKVLTDNYAQSLDKSNKSAKALKKTVLGFDELNQLQDNNSSGDSTLDAFDTVPVEEKWKDFAERIKKTWDSIIAPIKKAWEEMASGVSEAWKRAFSNIKTLLKDIGKDFLEVWNQQETIDMFKDIFGIIEDIGLIVGNLAERFDIAWKKNEVGKRILEDIRDIFAIIIQHIRNASSVTVEWSKKLDFTPLLEAFEGWLTSMKPVVDAIAGVFEDFYTNVILPLTKWSIEEGLPKLIQVFTDFNEKVKWSELRQKLQTLWEHLEPFAENVGEGLILFIHKITDALAEFINGEEFENFLQSIEDWMDNVSPEDVADGLEKIAKGLIAIKVASLGLSAIQGLIGIFGSLAGAMSVVKLGLEGLLVAVVAFVSYSVGNLIGEALFPDDAELYQRYSGIKGMLDLLKDTSEALVYVLGEHWNQVKENIKSYEAAAIASWNYIKKTATEVTKSITDGVENFKTKASQNFEDFKDKCSEVWEGIKKFGTDSLESIGETATNITESIKESFSSVWEDLKTGFSNVIDFFKELWNDIADGISGDHEIFGHKFKVELPKFAMGGFPEDGLFMANHGEMVGKFSNGKTAVANNEQITDGIAKAVYSAIMNANASSGSQSTQYINNTIQVDGETIARAVTKGQQSLNRRYNPSGAY